MEEIEVIILPIDGKTCECEVGTEFKKKVDPDIYAVFIGCFCGGCGGELK